jgi:outer membrane protein OmpA-like peptidoglycan-associated protein
MSIVCSRCGSSLAEDQSFCTSCGTRLPDTSARIAARFCTGCGATLTSGSKFCEKCGASTAAQQATIATAAAAAPRLQVVSSPAPTQLSNSPPAPPAKSGSRFLKFVMSAVVLVVIVLLLAMGSCAYIAYRAKQRYDKVEQAYKKDDLAGMIAAASGKTETPQPLPTWKAASADLVSSPSSKIALIKSLKTVNVGSDPLRGDYESIFVVDTIDSESVHIKASQQFPSGDNLDRLLNGKSASDTKPRTIQCGRTVFRADMENANEADGYFCREGRDEKRPGTTAMTISRKEFNELKTTGQAEVMFHEDPLRGLLKSFKNAMAAGNDASADKASADLLNKMMSFAPGNNPGADTPAVKYTIRRQGNGDLAFPVLVNDRPSELPVMDILCRHPDGNEGHIYVLDDPDNPMFLAAASTQLGREQVTKIYWDREKPSADDLADQLEKGGRVKVYDLYFDFASSTLRPESNKVLSEIAKVMHNHPDWKLSVEGHTDNVGGDKSNLELSKHRAAAVVDALAANYGINADRFSAAGFGASHPVDTNETIEGRARNRRVELVRR